jgi:DtxR family Mn-dependent transcriptional regulator
VRADRVEHELTLDEVDALSAKMGDPVFDPHGDPIPSAAGTVQLPAGRPLCSIPDSTMVRIVHIEDEPESTYRLLRDAQLQSGMIVTIVGSSPDGIELDTGVTRCSLAPLVAANVTVQPVEEGVADRISLRRLSALACGEEARVTDLSPACRGVERRRLLDLGLVPGTIVKAEFASPARDPVAYRVRGALIALRTQQADMIHITDP